MRHECKRNQPNISVIVPVYKVEPYLRTCVESILKQTYKDFELILVDDGSPDNCPAICEGYAAKHDFVKVIHKKNGGLSDARNVGMEHASGKYITFIDSDDCIDDKYLEYLWEGIATTGADISRIGFTKFYNDAEIEKEISKGKPNVIVLESKEALARILYQTIGEITAWGMLLPIEIARLFPFPFGKLHEDFYVTYNYYLFAEKITFIDIDAYYYRQNKDSITHQSMKLKNALDIIEASNNIVAACAEDDLLQKAAQSIQFNNFCYILMRFPKFAEEDPSDYKTVKNYLENTAFDLFRDSNCLIKNRIKCLCIALFGVSFLNWVRWVRSKLKR